ncbi:MAG: hypothetical protein AAGK21_02495 [Bacteroidota bacterium]
MRYLPLFAVLLALGVGCDEQPPDPALTSTVPEAEVERFRAEIFQETLTIDADLAELEGEAEAADSIAQMAYAPVLDRLRGDRRRLQVRLDSLRPIPQAPFDTVRAAIRAQTDRLSEAIGRARYDAAPTYSVLRAVAGRGLAGLDSRVDRLRRGADTNAVSVADLDSLVADRERLAGTLGAYPDTLESQFPPFRQRVTDRLLALEQRADVIAADTLRRALPDTAAVRQRVP